MRDGRACRKLNVDPIELRMRNEPTEDPEKHIPYSSRHLIACMQEGARRFAWDKRNPKPGQVRDGHWLVGMGMAAATRGNPLQLSKANVRLNPDGTATVRMAMTDIGTGTYTILAQIAAEMLGLPTERVRVELGDTNFRRQPVRVDRGAQPARARPCLRPAMRYVKSWHGAPAWIRQPHA